MQHLRLNFALFSGKPARGAGRDDTAGLLQFLYAERLYYQEERNGVIMKQPGKIKMLLTVLLLSLPACGVPAGPAAPETAGPSEAAEAPEPEAGASRIRVRALSESDYTVRSLDG